MPVTSKTWEQVGEKFETLGEHLRGHFDDVGTDASAQRAALEKSVRGLLAALEDGFAAAGKAVRDPVLRDDLTKVAGSVREAMLATFETAGEQVRERMSRPHDGARPAAKRAAVKRAATPRKAVAKKTAARKPSKSATHA